MNEKESKKRNFDVDYTDKYSRSKMYDDDSKKNNVNKKASEFKGSHAFLVFFVITLFIWLMFNIVHPFGLNFDPYPFVVLNILLGVLSSIQAPFVIANLNKKARLQELHRRRYEKILKKEERELKKIQEHLYHQDGRMENMFDYLTTKH